PFRRRGGRQLVYESRVVKRVQVNIGKPEKLRYGGSFSLGRTGGTEETYRQNTDQPCRHNHELVMLSDLSCLPYGPKTRAWASSRGGTANYCPRLPIRRRHPCV